jgi:3-oxoacyl-[acyl-carrier-protein] synthase III
MADHADCIIESLGICLPDNSVSTTEFLRSSSAAIRRGFEFATGIKSRRVAGDDYYSIDLARQAIVRCIANSHYRESDIELLILCSICRFDGPGQQFSYEPNTSFQLARDLNLVNAQTLDASNACAGMFTGIAIARAFIANGTVRNVLVASGENISHIAQTAQKEISGLGDSRLAGLTLGDAGAAIILERSGSAAAGFHDLELYTLSEHSKLCIARPTLEKHGGIIMFTDAVSMSTIALSKGIELTAEVMDRHEWSFDKVDHWIVHQTSRRSIKRVRRETETTFQTNVPATCNLVDNLEERGNTASTSHFVALADEMAAGRIAPGDKVLFGIAASGLTLGTALYTMDDLPKRMIEGCDRKGPEQNGTNGRSPGHRNNGLATVRVESVGLPNHWPLDSQTDIDLAKESMENCLAASVYERGEIDLVIYCGVYRSGFVFEPAIASLLAGDLGIATQSPPKKVRAAKSFAFDVFNGAAGYLWACHIAAQFIQQNSYGTAMIVAAEFPDNYEAQSRNRRGIAKTASATILDRTQGDGPGFRDFMFHNFYEYQDLFSARLWVQPGKSEVRYISKGNLEDTYLDCISRSLRLYQAQSGIDVTQMDYILGPQMGSAFARSLSDATGLPASRIVDVAEETGDLFTSSFAYSMHHLKHSGLGNPGENGIVIAAGPGVQMGCASYRF